MAKAQKVYVCQECGAKSPKWLGQCPSCEAWNTFVEEKVEESTNAPNIVISSPAQPLMSVVSAGDKRLPTEISEFDRICGGGLVAGQVLLVGGDPGIGKSTLLLQIAEALAKPGREVLYVSGEESQAQAKMRAERLNIKNPDIWIMAETNLAAFLQEAKNRKPAILLVDSIQVMYDQEIGSAPGSVAQVRECTAALVRFAKKEMITTIIVGHVTKSGAIAGPRVMEHLVDTVLYFEGERHNIYRILRSVKNRYGSTDEIGVFEMTGKGLVEVKNPSAIFLAQRLSKNSGSAVGTSLEGTRPILMEVQALCAKAPYGTPARKALGCDPNRLLLLLAVLEKRIGIPISAHDVYVNIAGGLKIDEPGMDLALLAAVASSYFDVCVADDTVLIGEVGLGGEVRAVSQIERRVMEAIRLGFKRCVMPAHNLKSFREKGRSEVEWNGMTLVGCADAAQAIRAALPSLVDKRGNPSE